MSMGRGGARENAWIREGVGELARGSPNPRPPPANTVVPDSGALDPGCQTKAEMTDNF